MVAIRRILILGFVLCVFASAAAQSAPTLGVHSINTACDGSATCTCTLTGVTAGSTLIYSAGWNNSSATITTAPTGYASDNGILRGAGATSQITYRKDNASSGTNAISLVVSAAPGRYWSLCFEAIGTPSSASLDLKGWNVTGGNNAMCAGTGYAGTSTTTCPSPTGAVSQSNEMIVLISSDLSTAATSYTVGTGFTAIEPTPFSSGGRIMAQYNSATGLSGAQVAAATNNNSQTTISEILTLKGATPAVSSKVNNQSRMY